MEQVDGIRLQKFRQLKKEIRGSDEFLIVGIDVAKERHNAFFGTAAGKTLHKGLFFENTIEGFQKLLAITEALKIRNDLANVVFGLEPTANYHKPLGEHLIECGHMVVLVAGAAVKHNRMLLDGRWDKHDTKDSAKLRRNTSSYSIRGLLLNLRIWIMDDERYAQCATHRINVTIRDQVRL